MKQQKSQGIQSVVGKIAGTLLLLVLFTMFACTSDQDQQNVALTFPVEFELPQTRATDTTFDDGDKIGIYAVENGKTFVESGNYADNRQYSYQAGKFRPVTSAEQIYVVKGKNYTYHAYYPYRSGINPGNIEFNAVNITTKDRPLWSMNNTISGNVVRLPFDNIFGLVEVNVNETADKIVSGAMLNKLPKVTVNMCENKTTTSSSQTRVSIPLTLYNSSNSVSTFRTLLPAGNTIASGDELFSFVTAASKAKKYYATGSTTITAGAKNVFNLTLLEEYIIKATSTVGGSITDAVAWASGKTFQDGQLCSLSFTPNSGYFFDGIYENNVKQNCSSSPYTFNVTKARTLEVRFKPDVITYGNWVVSVSASPTNIAASGGTSTISASAVRDVFTNGVKTGTDTGTPTLSASGTGFSLSGKILTAGNNTGSSRSCTVTATHGGVSKTCTVTQSGASITYEYSFSVTPTFLSFSSKGQSKTFTVTSTRVKFVNGTSTGTSENVNYTSSVSGTNASAFTVSGTSVTASNNPTADFRDATVTLTQAGSGKTVTITLEQEGKIDIGTEI